MYKKMSLRLPKCDFCKHLEDGEIYKCSAFPESIPLENLSDDENAECAKGIKFEEDRGGPERKEYVPNPESILEKMILVSPRRYRK